MGGDDPWIASVLEEAEEDLESEPQDLQDACLFLIESNETMLSKHSVDSSEPPTMEESTKSMNSPDRAECSLYQSIRVAYSLMRKKVITSPKDLIGIIIYNTACVKKDSQLNNCVVIRDLAPTDAKSIRAVRSLLDACDKDPDALHSRFTPQVNEPNALAEALSVANSLFRAKTFQKANKRVLILTDNANPYGQGAFSSSILERYRQTSLTYAKDMSEMNITIEPFFINHSEESPFNRRIFWDSFLEDSTGAQAEQVPLVAPVDKMFSALLEAASMRESPKRTLWTIPFTIAEGLVIGIKGYGMVIEEKRKAYTWYDPHTQQGEEVAVVTELQDFASADKIAAKDCLKYCTVGDGQSPTQAQRVMLTREEHQLARTLGLSPGLVLLGFLPRSKLSWHLHLKHSYFIFPDEETYSGSIRMFSALLRAMLKEGSEKVGIAVLVARKASTPYLVALLPQREVYESGLQIQPSGLYVCIIPWTDEVREAGITSTIGIVEEAEENEAINAAKNLIRKLKLRYTPGNFPNPALNFHYNCLAACALREPLPELEDKTIPRYAMFSRSRGDAIISFKEAVARHPRAGEKLGEPVRVSSGRRKADDKSGDDVTEEVEKSFENGTEKKLLVATLKAYATNKKLLDKNAKKAPLKADLIAIIGGHLKK